jgi:hypothetical protein
MERIDSTWCSIRVVRTSPGELTQTPRTQQKSNISSLCPLNNSIPIIGGAIIPVSSSDVSNIIPIALVIPDFEGSATLRMFSNSSQTQIACFSAVMRNGNSFSHPAAVGSTLGVFTIIALAA